MTGPAPKGDPSAKIKATQAQSPKPVKDKKQRASSWGRIERFFALDRVTADVVPNEEADISRYMRRMSIVLGNSFIIMGLSAALVLGIPFFEPVYRYFAVNPDHQVSPLAALNMPNMTNNAILSWSTTSITEIMTMGFGDYEQHLLGQRYRFTSEGWDSFSTAFDKQKIGEQFRQRQLVLTTVPSNTPVIIAQGVNEKHVYQWKVQMPVIMTYATNNDVTRLQKAIIELTIVRAPTDKYPAGIAIKNWNKG